MISGRIKTLHQDERGFTIVELLVVIVVIAILAAIAIVSYNGIVNQAIESTMKSDLRNASTALEIEKSTNGNYPIDTAALNNGQGLKSSGTNLLTYLGSGNTGPYCLNITNTQGSAVFHLNSAEGKIIDGSCGVWATTFAGSGTDGTLDGLGSAAQFQSVHDTAVDSAGNTYIAEGDGARIRKVSPAGAVTTFAGSSTRGHADGTGAAAQFRDPYGLAVDNNTGDVYVTDYTNFCIRKITPAAVVTTFAGVCDVPGTADGTGTAARFGYQAGIDVDTAGNVYVADYSNRCIRKITPAAVVTTFAGLCNAPQAYVDATGTAARFRNVWGIAVDNSNNVYVSEPFSAHRIRKITPAGVVTTFAGSNIDPGASGLVDATGTAARFNTPKHLAVDNAGNLYVADSYNGRIRKVTPAGVVTTVAGVTSWGYADGPGLTTAQFNTPEGIDVDQAGVLYVGDTWNYRLRKVMQ